MCNYPKTVFSCNHVQVAEKAVRTCPAQRDFLSGRAREPCDVVRSHPLSTVRQAFGCGYCRDKKTALDGKIAQARALIAEVGGKLRESSCCGGTAAAAAAAAAAADAADGPGLVDADDVALDAAGAVDRGSTGPGEEESSPRPDPVEEFLRKKLNAEDAHLMMLGS